MCVCGRVRVLGFVCVRARVFEYFSFVCLSVWPRRVPVAAACATAPAAASIGAARRRLRRSHARPSPLPLPPSSLLSPPPRPSHPPLLVAAGLFTLWSWARAQQRVLVSPSSHSECEQLIQAPKKQKGARRESAQAQIRNECPPPTSSDAVTRARQVERKKL